jgi:hypothetical protein
MKKPPETLADLFTEADIAWLYREGRFAWPYTIEDTLLVFRAIKGLPHRELVALAQEFQNEQGEFSIGSLPC